MAKPLRLSQCHPLTETGDAQLLKTCYDYMDGFKQVMDRVHHLSKWITSASSTRFFPICQTDGNAGSGYR
ncbi:hypothetical protein [Photorhabdus stackebrandtii]|uniref:hypothetical protein n=1 Tax=Photorhabdus stackebrandtii TaxID=1123042 RepID=UPI001F6111FC